MNLKDLLGAFSQGKSTAKSHMKNLIEMAAVDGNFDDVEFDLLKSIAKRNGISEGQFKEIQKNPNKVVFEMPTDPTEKFHQLYDLVYMMSIDKNVHSEELKLSHIFAIKFGYKRDQITELVETIQSNIEHGQGHEETMKRAVRLI